MLLSIEIGKNIVALRKIKGITQEQLALCSEMSISYLRNIEHGRANPTIGALIRLADTFKVPLILLFVFSWEEHELLKIIHKFQQEAKASHREKEM